MHDAMLRLHDACQCQCTVLISGEPGAGKSLFAKTIHQYGPRKLAPFIAFSPESADNIQSEIFGHKRGAAANAFADKPGLLDVANHGTFFLENIESVPKNIQTSILKLLDENTFTPLGDTTPRHADIRLIAACSATDALFSSPNFSPRLAHALNILHIPLPPLRKRPDDIPKLCEFFIRSKRGQYKRPHKTLTQNALDALMAYPWPGNLRELENEIERLLIVSHDSTTIDKPMLALRIQRETTTPQIHSHFPPDSLSQLLAQHKTHAEIMEILEKQLLENALRLNGNNRTHTAHALQLSRRTLLRKLAQFHIP